MIISNKLVYKSWDWRDLVLSLPPEMKILSVLAEIIWKIEIEEFNFLMEVLIHQCIRTGRVLIHR